MAKPATKTFDVAGFLSQVIPRENIIRYKRDQHIFKAGDPADKVYYLQEGKVKVTVVSAQGKEAVVAVTLAGEFFGRPTLSGRTVRIATAAPLDNSVLVIGIKKDVFQSLLASEPAFNHAFMMDLLKRNDQIESDLLDRNFLFSERRLARLLLRLANFHHQDGLIPNISQETLAEMVGTTRARVSFFMNNFRNRGLVSYDLGSPIQVNASLLSAVLHEVPDGDNNDE